jgi:hypothetical protein
MKTGSPFARGTAVAGAVFLIVGAGPALSEKVGVTAAVNPTATGQSPGQTVRQLSIGSDVVHNERIQTSSGGSTQVIFIDRTSLTISPNSDITINDYVYNRNAKSGNLSIKVAKGVMRFVGGEISHGGGARITTPSAVLGIRGGIAIVNSANNKTTVIHQFGTTTVSTGSNSVTITKPGYHTVAGSGQISLPSPPPPGLLASYYAQLQSKPGQTGGVAPGRVTSERVKNIVTNAPGKSLGPPGAQFPADVSAGIQSGQTRIGGPLGTGPAGTGPLVTGSALPTGPTGPLGPAGPSGTTGPSGPAGPSGTTGFIPPGLTIGGGAGGSNPNFGSQPPGQGGPRPN